MTFSRSSITLNQQHDVWQITRKDPPPNTSIPSHPTPPGTFHPSTLLRTTAAIVPNDTLAWRDRPRAIGPLAPRATGARKKRRPGPPTPAPPAPTRTARTSSQTRSAILAPWASGAAGVGRTPRMAPARRGTTVRCVRPPRRTTLAPRERSRPRLRCSHRPSATSARLGEKEVSVSGFIFRTKK